MHPLYTWMSSSHQVADLSLRRFKLRIKQPPLYKIADIKIPQYNVSLHIMALQ